MMTKAEKQRLEELLEEDEHDGTQLIEIKARLGLSIKCSFHCLFDCIGRGG